MVKRVRHHEDPVWRVALRAVLPPRLRRWLRQALTDLPVRVRDLGPDLRDAVFARRRAPLPPARLRRGVGRTSSRLEFLEVGRRAAADIVAMAEEAWQESHSPRRWLDFGCGSGRVTRHLIADPRLDLQGLDVDEAAVAWANRHLAPARFEVTEPRPPTRFPSQHFDVVSAVSVFTHFDRDMEQRWLAELRRLLKPGGLLIASTHNESLVWSRPDLSPAQLAELAERGFLFAPGSGPFNENSTFHREEYLRSSWGRLLELAAYRRHGLAEFQDLSAWRTTRRAAGSCTASRGWSR